MLIRCKLGPQISHCGGHTYDFAVDDQGRAVAEVYNAAHIKCFLAVEHYEEVVEAADDGEIEAVDAVDTDADGKSPEGGAQDNPAPQPARRGRKSRN